jgi:cytochrome P450
MIIFFAALLGLVVLAYLVAFYRLQLRFHHLPRPFGAIPLLGHGLQIALSDAPQNPMTWIEQTCRRYGYMPWLMQSLVLDHMVVVSDAALSSDILRRGSEFPRSYHFEEDNEVLGGKVLFAIDGGLWKSHRKLLNPFFSLGLQKRMLDTVKESLMEATEVVSRHAAEGTAFDLKSLLSRFTCDVISTVCFGRSFGCVRGCACEQLLSRSGWGGSVEFVCPVLFLSPADSSVAVRAEA